MRSWPGPYWRISSAIVAAARWQKGHWKSANSTMVTGAVRLPRTGSAAVTGMGPPSPSPSVRASSAPPSSRAPPVTGTSYGGAAPVARAGVTAGVPGAAQPASTATRRTARPRSGRSMAIVVAEAAPGGP